VKNKFRSRAPYWRLSRMTAVSIRNFRAANNYRLVTSDEKDFQLPVRANGLWLRILISVSAS
jgi:hypothetical protein